VHWALDDVVLVRWSGPSFDPGAYHGFLEVDD
jgi:hypothetical protein